MDSDDSKNYRISRRDYFAGCALKGLLCKEGALLFESQKRKEELANAAIILTDVLIKALDENDQEKA